MISTDNLGGTIMFIELYCQKSFSDFFGSFAEGEIYGCNFDIKNEKIFAFRLKWMLKRVSEGDLKIVAPWKYTKQHINQDLLGNFLVEPLIEYCESYYNR